MSVDDKPGRSGIFGPAAVVPPVPEGPDYRRLLPYAVAFATKRHGAAADRAGQPFIGHPLRVMARGAPDPFGMIVRVLHDTVEDTNTTLDDIRTVFGDEVTALVDALTHRKGQETYRQYIERLYLTPSARSPKRDDILDNADPMRIAPGVVIDGGQSLAEWHEAMVRTRYEPALHYLEHGEWP